MFEEVQLSIIQQLWMDVENTPTIITKVTHPQQFYNKQIHPHTHPSALSETLHGQHNNRQHEAQQSQHNNSANHLYSTANSARPGGNEGRAECVGWVECV